MDSSMDLSARPTDSETWLGPHSDLLKPQLDNGSVNQADLHIQLNNPSERALSQIVGDAEEFQIII